MFKITIPIIILFIGFCSCDHENQSDDELSALKQVELTTDTITYNYYGTGCFYLEYKGQAVFTDPAFRPQRMSTVLFGKLETDTNYINRLELDLSKVSMTLVGHGHYDHLMDLPFIADSFLPKESLVIGSRSVKNLVDSSIVQKVIEPSLKGNSINPSEDWIHHSNNSIKVLPIKANHAPHLFDIVFLSGEVIDTLAEVPTSVYQWKSGQVYTYLIDFMDPNKVIKKRVFFQSSTDTVPVFDHDDIPIDLAIVGGRGLTPDMFKKLNKKLKAKKYIAAHWEKNFKSLSNKIKPGKRRPFNKMKSFIKENRLEDRILFLDPLAPNKLGDNSR